MKTTALYSALLGTLFALSIAPAAQAADYAQVLTRARPDMPLAHPIATTDIAPPPLSLIADRPKDPVYVAGLPGLPQGRMITDDFGIKKPKFDGVFIRRSRVENGQVIIPPGGLVYLEDTWGGEVALRGEPLPVLGRMPTYIDYDMSIVVKENVTIPAGQSVTVGGQVYHYYATVGHEQTTNHALHVKSVSGTDWDWAFGNPVLSATQPGWWGMKFNQLYNQGQASEVTREKMVFDWISGVRMDRILLGGEKTFAGMAKAGQEWKIGERVVRLVEVNEKAGTVRIQVLEGAVVKLDRVLGPVQSDRLIEDSTARKALVFEFGDIAGFLVPTKTAIKDGQAELKLYSKTFSLNYGDTYANDTRFSVYPIACPTGHNFGFMLTNKEEIRLAPGASIEGPEKYFKVTVDSIDGKEVRGWHISDRDGNQSVNLGGTGVVNIDLVLGQGRVAGQAILKDVGRAMSVRMATALSQQAPSSMPNSMILTLAVLALGVAGASYELGKRRKK